MSAVTVDGAGDLATSDRLPGRRRAPPGHMLQCQPGAQVSFRTTDNLDESP
jgi:hypothetical protein